MARDLRGFIKLLEDRGQLRRISASVSADLEIAEIANRMLQVGGPALLFENVQGAEFPVAINLMGTVERICWAMNLNKPEELEDLGKKLALLQQPKPPKKLSQAIDFGKVLFDVLKAKPSRNFFPACQQVILEGDEVDLKKIPMIRPYPGDGRGPQDGFTAGPHRGGQGEGGREDGPGGLGAILTQVDKDGKFYAISFASRQLKDHEKNYSPFLLEAAAAVWGMDHFSEYLKGKKTLKIDDFYPIFKKAKGPML